MKSRSNTRTAPAVAALLALAGAAAFPGLALAQPYNCLPTCTADDARFLLIVNGAGFKTLSDPALDLTFVVPADTPSFTIGIFDGDILSGTLPDLHWDTGNPGLPPFAIPEFSYTVFADPGANVSGSQVVAGPFIGSSFLNPANVMPDNAWFDIPITTGPEAQSATGEYVYRLHIELDNPADTLVANSFKVRTSEIAVLEPIAQPFGYVAQRASGADEAIIYPSGFPGPTTYDGYFSFFVEAVAPQTSLSIWDGDFDRGDFNGGPSSDTDDPNTPSGTFEPTWSTGDTVPEGIAVGTGPSTGSPPDDNSADPSTDKFLRQPSVRYDVIAPDGKVYANENPSGNQEWEKFELVTTGVPTDPADCSSPSAAGDCTTGSLPAGSYHLKIDGVDLANFNFLLTESRILCVDENGDSCPPRSEETLFTVGDTVFEDSNGDGLQQTGEPGIQGVVVNLVAAAGNVLASTVTDADGNYSFGVAPGTYTVEVADENFTAAPAAGAIGDTVWFDLDGNGIEGPAEPGISNVTLQLWLDGGDGLRDGADDTLIATAVTDMDGRYLFDGLADGDYWVDVADFTVPAGLALSGGTDPSAVVPISANVVDTVDFGYANGDATTAVVGNFVWIDADGNGLQDAGEPGVTGVTVALRDGITNALVADTRTDAGGGYLFTGVAPGTYVVDVTDNAAILSAAGLVPTVTGAGAPDEDSNPDPTAPFVVLAGDAILDKDFGYVNAALADLSDVVWFDENRNGLLDGAEMGIAGVTVNLVDARGDVIASTTTDALGELTFADLPDGTYALEISDLDRLLRDDVTGIAFLPTTAGSARRSQTVVVAGADVFGVNFGWIDEGALGPFTGTTPGSDGDVDRETREVVDADVLTYDFGYSQFTFVGDRVWKDENGDGIQNTGEPGLGGVSVALLDAGGVVVASTTTGSDGEYLFDQLVPGDYTVVVDGGLPAGLQPTYDFDDADVTEPIASPNEADVTLPAGQGNLDVDFGYDDCSACQGKVTQLTLQYLGTQEAMIRVVAKRGRNLDVIFEAAVEPGANFTLEAPDNDTAKKGFAGTLGTEIRIYVDGERQTTIHTSCSVPIGPGFVSGDFQVVWGTSREGGLLCPIDGGGGTGGAQCSECSGKVTFLVLRYTGDTAAFIEVTQKRPAEAVFSNLVQSGEELFFAGTDHKGTLGTEISVFVDGVETRVHTSCSVPIGPGLAIGDSLVVREGGSRNGGSLCPL